MEVARHRVNLTAMWETWLTLTLWPLWDDPLGWAFWAQGLSGQETRGQSRGFVSWLSWEGLRPRMQYPPEPGSGLSETSVEESFRTWGNM